MSDQKPFSVDKYIKERKIEKESEHYVYPDGTRSDFTKGDSCYSIYDKRGKR